jgi:hypothetical protein
MLDVRAVAALALCTVAVIPAPVCAEVQRATGTVRLSGARVLVVPVYVEVHEIGAGGQSLLKADWTEAARGFIRAAVEANLADRSATVISYTEPEQAERRALHSQIGRVHGLVARAILNHQYVERFRLPGKGGRFEWTLGPAVSALSDDEGQAEYALFVTFVEGHASGGRAAMNVAAAVFGGMMITGRQTGIASLVDLKTGDVVWFNLDRSAEGDLRNEADARQSVKRLLAGLPF